MAVDLPPFDPYGVPTDGNPIVLTFPGIILRFGYNHTDEVEDLKITTNPFTKTENKSFVKESDVDGSIQNTRDIDIEKIILTWSIDDADGNWKTIHEHREATIAAFELLPFRFNFPPIFKANGMRVWFSHLTVWEHGDPIPRGYDRDRPELGDSRMGVYPKT